MSNEEKSITYQLAKSLFKNYPNRISISHMQRRLKIGYNKAYSVMEELEVDGVVSAPNEDYKRSLLK